MSYPPQILGDQHICNTIVQSILQASWEFLHMFAVHLPYQLIHLRALIQWLMRVHYSGQKQAEDARPESTIQTNKNIWTVLRPHPERKREREESDGNRGKQRMTERDSLPSPNPLQMYFPQELQSYLDVCLSSTFPLARASMCV